MKLTELEASFIRWESRKPSARDRELNPQFGPEWRQDWFIEVPTLAEAHGIHFICPKGFASGDCHMVQVFFVGSPVPDRLGKNKNGKTVRWTATGSGLGDLTLAPSIEEQGGGCNWHGFVTRGDAA